MHFPTVQCCWTSSKVHLHVAFVKFCRCWKEKLTMHDVTRLPNFHEFRTASLLSFLYMQYCNGSCFRTRLKRQWEEWKYRYPILAFLPYSLHAVISFRRSSLLWVLYSKCNLHIASFLFPFKGDNIFSHHKKSHWAMRQRRRSPKSWGLSISVIRVMSMWRSHRAVPSRSKEHCTTENIAPLQHSSWWNVLPRRLCSYPESLFLPF